MVYAMNIVVFYYEAFVVRKVIRICGVFVTIFCGIRYKHHCGNVMKDVWHTHFRGAFCTWTLSSNAIQMYSGYEI